MVKKAVVQSDNFANCNNILVLVIAPFIFMKYEIKLCTIFRAETQDGKGLAYVHITKTMTYVDPFIDSLALNFTTSEDLVDSINHGKK